jgi:pantoate--beta-alanine ligase
MSSRNQYLSADERDRAAAIYETLKAMRRALEAGEAIASIEAAALKRLKGAGLVPDYATLRRADDLGEPAATSKQGLVALIAARMGRTRLIDNLACATGATHDL